MYELKKSCRWAAAIALSMLSANAMAANLLTNGSFETPDVPSSKNYADFRNPGSTSITGWTVALRPTATATSVGLVDNVNFGYLGVVASDGNQMVDLTGNIGRGAGLVSDAFGTQSGHNYVLSYDVGAFFVGAGSFGDATIDVFVNGAQVTSSTNLLALKSQGSDWERFSIQFAGTGNPMTVSFFSSLLSSSSDLGVGLDNVVLEAGPSAPAVPEPASWAMMIGGFGLLGAAMRRRAARICFA